MGIFRQFPYSNFHEMNMDDIIKIIKNMLEEWAQYHAEWDAWMDEINEDWSNYQEVMNEAWQNMQDFINNYFDNLDVQNEINNKITSMVNSGEFATIVNPYIPPSVTAWLSAHITEPVGVVIDTSLSVSGACADAKATGDAIATVKSAVNDMSFADGCSWIKELYINEDGVADGLTNINNIQTYSNGTTFRLRFANSDGTAFKGDTDVFSISDKPYEIVPIYKYGDTSVIYGYIIADFSWVTSNTGIGKPLNVKAFHLDYSPRIYTYLNDQTTQDEITKIETFLSNIIYAEDCNWIKELYITEEGETAGLAQVNNIVVANNKIRLRFSNSDGSAFVGTTDYYDLTDLPNYIIPIRADNSPTTIYGYAIIDFSGFTNNSPVNKMVLEKSYYLDYAPSIKAELSGDAVLTARVTTLENITETIEDDLSYEIAARTAADAALGARIDNLVAPSGQSIAEVTDARVGATGIVYASLEARLNAEYAIFNKKTNKIITVGGSGQDYSTISSAISASSDGDIILVYPGIYHEAIARTAKVIHIVGVCRDDCILEYENGDYADPPLEMTFGSIKNMTIHAIQQEVQNETYGKAYAFHIDGQSSGVLGGYFRAENVKFINDDYRTVGVGLRGESIIEFVDCEFICSSGYEALYCHDANRTSYEISDQKIAFRNCTFIANSNDKHTIEMVSQERRADVASITWQRNIVVNKGSGGVLDMSIASGSTLIDGNGWLGSSDWVLTADSALNTVQNMNA